MSEQDLTDKEVIKLSKKDYQVYSSSDNRFVFRGKIYYSEEELKKGIEKENKILEEMVKLSKRPFGKWLLNLSKFFSRKNK